MQLKLLLQLRFLDIFENYYFSSNSYFYPCGKSTFKTTIKTETTHYVKKRKKIDPTLDKKVCKDDMKIIQLFRRFPLQI